MTPLLVVRSEDGSEVEVPEADVETTLRSTDYEVLMIVFDREAFSEEATVKAWLDDGGYQDYTIIAKDDTFEVGSLEEGREVREVKMKGASVFVAHKLDISDAARAEGAGAVIEGLKPVAKKAEAPVITEERRKSLYQVVELASLVTYTAWLVDDMSFEALFEPEGEGDAQENQALSLVKQAGLALLNALSTLVGAEVSEMTASFKSELELTLEASRKAAPVIEAPVVEAEATSEEAAKEETPAETVEEAAKEEVPAVEEPAAEAANEETPEVVAEVEAEKIEEEPKAEVTEEVAKEVVSEDEDVKTVLKTLADTVKQLTTTVSELQAASVAKSQDEVDRVTGEDDRQSRKGADVDEVATETSQEARSRAEMADLRTRAVLGIRTRSR